MEHRSAELDDKCFHLNPQCHIPYALDANELIKITRLDQMQITGEDYFRIYREIHI